jgi:hypothetical protein
VAEILRRSTVRTSGCWEWQQTIDASGYGRLTRAGRQGVKAHRVAWECANGPIPDGLWVLHRCDNRRCVNPEHLYVGDRADNMADMVERGRSTRKATCLRGHEFDTELRGGRRYCRRCNALNARRRRRAKEGVSTHQAPDGPL